MADTTIGAKLSLDAGDSSKTLKQIKQDIKDAKNELLDMQHKFGATSDEAFNAAKKVAELTDSLKEAKEVTDLFDPGKRLASFAGVLNTVLNGFTAVTGAMGLLGTESAEVEKQLLKVQSALALTSGVNALLDSAKDFKRFGAIIVQTLGKSGAIGLAIAGVGALIAEMSGLFSKEQTAAAKAYNETIEDFKRAAAGALVQVINVRVAFEQARDGVIKKDEALKIYNDTLGDSLGKTKDINEAERLLAEKADTYIKITGLKAQANALFAKSAEQAANAIIAQDELLKSGLLGEGGIVSAAANKVQDKINKSQAQAKEIENLGANLLRQAAQLEQQANITTSSGKKSILSTPTKQEDDYFFQSIKDRGEIATRTERDFTDSFIEEINKREQAEKAYLERRAEFITKDRDLSISIVDELIAKQKEQADQIALNAEIEKEKANARIENLKNVSAVVSGLSELVGRETAVGKALAVAQATIDTYAAAAAILKNAARTPAGGIPGYAIAQAAATILFGLAQVKKILSVKVPKGGGGGEGVSTSAPIQPQLPQSTNTRLDQDQLNQIGNATVRAFVVETDVTNNQERIRRLNRAARI